MKKSDSNSRRNKTRPWRKRKPIRLARKWFYQQFLDRREIQTPLFVFGCQRSGTSVFTQLFQYDLSSKVYGEKGLSDARTPGRDGRYRLLPYDQLQERMSQERATLLVSKPLVESQNARKILDFFTDGKGVWMVRHFADVAYSSLRMFSRETAMRNLRHLVVADAEPSFASEGVGSETRDVVLRFFSEQMTGDEAQVLFWYVRNKLFFDQDLQTHERVLALCYEDLVSDPERIMGIVYEFLGRAYPGPKMTAGIHRNSVDRDIRLDAQPDLLALCEDLHRDLNDVSRR